MTDANRARLERVESWIYWIGIALFCDALGLGVVLEAVR